MSEQNPPGDEPTRAYTGINDDVTRLDRPIQPYGGDQEAVPSLYAGGDGHGAHGSPPSGPGIVAPLVTVALISILLGIGVGYLLFNNSSSGKATATTTTTAVVASTTAAPSTTTSFATTSTSEHPTTSTTIRTTTTSVRSTTTTTLKTTSTSSDSGTTSTTA